MAKIAQGTDGSHNECFIGFEPQTVTAVVEYLDQFLNLDVVDTNVKQHVAKWLRGRPRWTASFVEVYLSRDPVVDHKGTRGSFNTSEARIVQALDRYIRVMTTDGSDSDDIDRSRSWSAGDASAYAAIGKVMKKANMFGIQSKFRQAIFDYSVGGKRTIFDGNVEFLIEVGVAAVSTQKSNATVFAGVLDEPLVVQAGINFFTSAAALNQRLQEQQTSGRGDGIEQFLLPALQTKLQDLLTEQLGQLWEPGKYFVSALSSYGVLAIKCEGISDTIDWIRSATSDRFEGQVPPFCYLDKHFGPDVVFLMWNAEYEDYISALTQAKFSLDLEQPVALQTIDPKLLYIGGKGDQARSFMMSNELWHQWKSVEKALIGEDGTRCLRLMIQDPKEHPKLASPGRAHLDDKTRCSNTGCKRKHALLSTVSGTNAEVIFGPKAIAILDFLKGEGASE